MRVLCVNVALMFSITGLVGGCVGASTDTEDTAGTEGGPQQGSGLPHTGKGTPGDDTVDDDALKSPDLEFTLPESLTGADTTVSKSNIARPSAQLTQSSPSCPAVAVRWSQWQAVWNGNARTGGSYSCNANFPSVSSGVTVTASLSGERVGSLQLTCNNGTWVPVTGSCDGGVTSTMAAAGISTTCSSSLPDQSKWIGWYLADLKRCADTAGLNWWVNSYVNDTDCLATDNYHGYGSKDACWRAQFRSGADANGNSYSEAQATGHVSAWDEAYLCNGRGYPWTSVSSSGTSCKSLP